MSENQKVEYRVVESWGRVRVVRTSDGARVRQFGSVEKAEAWIAKQGNAR